MYKKVDFYGVLAFQGLKYFDLIFAKKGYLKIFFTSLFTIDQHFIKIRDAFDMRPSYPTGQSI
jgi:hypothetical protein